MSRIRSQLDTLMAGGPDYPEPRPAFAPRHPIQPQYGQSPQSAMTAPAQPRPELEALQNSLAQLSQKIATLPQHNPNSAGQDQTAALGQMRETVVHEVRNGLGQVRSDLTQAGEKISNDVSQAVSQSLSADLQRISHGISMLQEDHQTHPDYIDQMQNELGNLNSGINQLLANTPNQVDLSGITKALDSNYSDLVNKLDTVLSQRGSELPEIEIPDYSDDLAGIHSRLEEVARAVVSLAVNPEVATGNDAIDRIEARLASLSKSVDDILQASGQMATTAIPDNSFGETISAQISKLSEKLDNLDTMGAAGKVLENQIFPDVQEIANRIDALQGDFGVLASNLERNLENQASSTPDQARFDALEERLSNIAAQLGTLSVSSSNSTDFTPLTERLDHIEGQIASSRDIVIDIATEAAQKAVTRGGDDESSQVAMASVLDELRSLREEHSQHRAALLQNAEQQQTMDNSQLGEIGSTMAAIAERLSHLEASVQNGGATPAFDAVPHSSFEHRQHADTPEQEYVAPDLSLSDNSQAALTDPGGGSREMPVGEPQEFVSVEDAPSIDMSEALESDVSPEPIAGNEAGSEPAHEDVPLEPGSGMPDLETLVKKATNRKKGLPEEEGITDLMAAARRAAQAASLEAESIREGSPQNASSVKSKLPKLPGGNLFNKKNLLMTAAVAAIAIGGVALAPKFFGSSDAPVETASAPVSDSEIKQLDNIEAASEVSSSEETFPTGIEESGSAAIGAAENLLASEQGATAAPLSLADNNQQASDDAVSQETVPANISDVAESDLPSEELGNIAFRKAIAAGDGNAMFEAGKRYTDGQVVPRDLKEAVSWYTKAAEADHGPAQYRLGNFYEKGHGVEADPALAAQWYTKAANKGNALAMHNLAVLNAMGVVGGDADMPTAIDWFEKAANLGVKDSQVNLGILYTKGMGVQEDLEKAYKWFAIAAKGGDSDAGKKRDTVAQAMRPEQLERARGAAEIWKPKQLDARSNVAVVKDEWRASGAKKAMSNTEMVRLTQSLLTRAGFDPGPADGLMGEKTRQAIIAFQKANGLKADGTITPQLVEALNKISI